jgi:hypothetical protein
MGGADRRGESGLGAERLAAGDEGEIVSFHYRLRERPRMACGGRVAFRRSLPVCPEVARPKGFELLASAFVRRPRMCLNRCGR